MALRQAASQFTGRVWSSSLTNRHLLPSLPRSIHGSEWPSFSLSRTGVEFSSACNYTSGAHVARAIGSELVIPAGNLQPTAQVNNPYIGAPGWHWSSKGASLAFRSKAHPAASCPAAFSLVSPRGPANLLRSFSPPSHDLDLTRSILHESAITKDASHRLKPFARRGFASSSRSVLQQQACASRPTADLVAASRSLHSTTSCLAALHLVHNRRHAHLSPFSPLSLSPSHVPAPSLWNTLVHCRSGCKCTSRALASLATRIVPHPHLHPSTSCMIADCSAARTHRDIQATGTRQRKRCDELQGDERQLSDYSVACQWKLLGYGRWEE